MRDRLGRIECRQFVGFQHIWRTKNNGGLSRRWILAECDASLKRLGLDHVDIYYLHRDYNGMQLEEPLRALEALLRDGKIRYWGVSNFRDWRIAEVSIGRANATLEMQLHRVQSYDFQKGSFTNVDVVTNYQ